jgi:hypothetical protein
MREIHQSCPTCTCATEHLKPWFDATLIPTDNPADMVSSARIYSAYIDWMLKHQPENWLSQNNLTRWLRRQALDIQTRGGRGNYLIGYRLAPQAPKP